MVPRSLANDENHASHRETPQHIQRNETPHAAIIRKGIDWSQIIRGYRILYVQARLSCA